MEMMYVCYVISNSWFVSPPARPSEECLLKRVEVVKWVDAGLRLATWAGFGRITTVPQHEFTNEKGLVRGRSKVDSSTLDRPLLFVIDPWCCLESMMVSLKGVGEETRARCESMPAPHVWFLFLFFSCSADLFLVNWFLIYRSKD